MTTMHDEAMSDRSLIETNGLVSVPDLGGVPGSQWPMHSNRTSHPSPATQTYG